MRPLVALLCLGIAQAVSAQTAPAAAAPPKAAPTVRPNGLYATIRTSMGTITARLYEKETPMAVQNFVGLAQGTKPWRDPKTEQMIAKPLFQNLTFHRIIRDEMVQTGDPTGTGGHRCGIKLRDEFLPGLRFDRGGKLAVANTGLPDTGGCQFFITAGPVARWDNKYTIFGEVVSGMSVVTALNHVPLRDDKPVTPPKLIGITIQRVGPEPPPAPAKK